MNEGRKGGKEEGRKGKKEKEEGKKERKGRRKERKKRKKDTGTQALMEQMRFNEFSVSIYKLWYKKFLTIMIKIRKPSV